VSDAANRLLEKLKLFAEALDDEERALLAALLAPGVANAYGEDEVEGFDAGVGWRPDALPQELARAIEDRGLRITGL
jgi:hypothetical protein